MMTGLAETPPAAVADWRTTKLALITLGVQAGPPPSAHHYGISTALVVNGTIYIVDCGRSSVSQFFKAGLDIASLAGLFITHMHVDHTIDYIAYHQLCGGMYTPDQFEHPIFSYGPGPPGDLGTPPPGYTWAQPETPGLVQMTELQLRAFSASDNLFISEAVVAKNRSRLLEPHDIVIPPSVGANPQRRAPDMEPFAVMEDDNIRVTATLVSHAKVFPAFGFRFDTEHGSVTFSGDTTVSSNLMRLAQQTDVLVHEAINTAWFEEAGVPAEMIKHHEDSHTSIADVGMVAREADAKSLVVSHYAPAQIPLTTWTEQLDDSCRRAGYVGDHMMARDGHRVPFLAA